jgi:hypothetical protein
VGADAVEEAWVGSAADGVGSAADGVGSAADGVGVGSAADEEEGASTISKQS